MYILGVRIDNFTRQEILGKIEGFLNEDGFHQIATVNPEFILRAQKDGYFKNILNKTSLNVADGIGIKFAFVRYFSWLKARIAGVDLMHEILQIADEKKSKLFLAIHKNGLSSYEEIRKVLHEKYPNIEVSGGNIDPRKNKKWPSIVGYSLVFCNFGFPQQEKFIFQQKNDTIRLAMGVGGSFDFLTGKVRRAPEMMRYLGLEWLFRLIQEPSYRVKRVFRAAVIFPIRIILNR